MTPATEGPLSLIPMRSLSLRLMRATIKMHHGPKWRVDKMNPTHDLIVGLEGQGSYQIAGQAAPVVLSPGEAMMVPAYTRFQGVHGGGDTTFIGLAQHFTLDLFGRGDFIRQMDLKLAVPLPHWDEIGPLARLYRQTAPTTHVTLEQHHMFMVLLMAYLNAAFTTWRTEVDEVESQDHLSMQIMLTASQLASDPLGGRDVDEMLQAVPYNADYFRRAFRDRLGYTPHKFRELKRMEFAANLLAKGMTVKAVAAELNYADPYFFSRMFKRYLGASPARFKETSAKQDDDVYQE